MSKVDNTGVGPDGYSVPELPRLSLTERDRGWANVRAMMARDNMDVILSFSHSGWWDTANSSGRYLSHVGGNCSPVSVVFPRDGRVTALGAFGTQVDVCAKVAEGTPYVCKPIAHGRGYGMDGPVLVYEARDDRTKNWPIAENLSFMVNYHAVAPHDHP